MTRKPLFFNGFIHSGEWHEKWLFWATMVFMPLIVVYTSWAYRVMRGKVTLAHIRGNEHSAY